MNRRTSIKWNGKEVQSPFRRKLVVLFALITIPVFFLLGMLLLLIVLPVALILHPFLRLFGRRGTVRTSGGNFEISLDREAFRRA